jgi:hypothetical protein
VNHSSPVVAEAPQGVDDAVFSGVMGCVYHGVPREMVGQILYPLNQLAALAPQAYELQRSKYLGREAVLDARISSDGLLFNDTVHCAPLHPYRLFAARRRLGFGPPSAQERRDSPPSAFSGLFFAVPLERVAAQRVLWYRWQKPWINGYPNEDVPLTPPLDEFEPFDHRRYRELAEVTEAHLAYLRRLKQEGKRGLLFPHIPHVLVAGPIDTSGLPVISWNEPPTDP